MDAVVDTVPTPASRAAALATAQRQATARAVAAGARPGSCWVAALEEVPLAYLPGSVSRVRVKVIGELAIDQLGAGQQGGVAPGQPSLEPAPAQARTASTEATPRFTAQAEPWLHKPRSEFRAAASALRFSARNRGRDSLAAVAGPWR